MTLRKRRSETTESTLKIEFNANKVKNNTQHLSSHDSKGMTLRNDAQKQRLNLLASRSEDKRLIAFSKALRKTKTR
jgi:hypothetical protein